MMSQNTTLEDLTSRKKEIIHHLQEEPTFLDPLAQVYQADSCKGGFDGLRTVLTNNMRKREAMPKLVSDVFVATRSTQSLDMYMVEDVPQYQTWSSGEDLLVTGKNEPICSLQEPESVGMTQALLPPRSGRGQEQQNAQGDQIPFDYKTNAETVYREMPWSSSGPYNTCSGDLMLSSSSSVVRSLAPSASEAEFSRFPNDDDETFIPFEHTSVSRFGPISRMARAKTNNCAPVQVTADSNKRVTPMLPPAPHPIPHTGPPLERPGPIATPVTSSRSLALTTVKSEMAEPSVKPTPTETPSIWQESPVPSFINIARLKAGAAGAISNNERLAYELQAVELEISLKTGKEPEPVCKMIQEAVMGGSVSPPPTQEVAGPHHHQHYPPSGNLPSQGGTTPRLVNAPSHYSTAGLGDLGRGHVTDCLTMFGQGRSMLTSSEKAAQQRLMEEYFRSFRGHKH